MNEHVIINKFINDNREKIIKLVLEPIVMFLENKKIDIDSLRKVIGLFNKDEIRRFKDCYKLGISESSSGDEIRRIKQCRWFQLPDDTSLDKIRIIRSCRRIGLSDIVTAIEYRLKCSDLIRIRQCLELKISDTVDRIGIIQIKQLRRGVINIEDRKERYRIARCRELQIPETTSRIEINKIVRCRIYGLPDTADEKEIKMKIADIIRINRCRELRISENCTKEEIRDIEHLRECSQWVDIDECCSDEENSESDTE